MLCLIGKFFEFTSKIGFSGGWTVENNFSDISSNFHAFYNRISWFFEHFKVIFRAKKGLFSFSYAPLNFLTLFSIVVLAITMVLVVYQVSGKLFFPDSAPKGITTLLLVSLGFGSTIMLAISLLGEYIARIFEEVKQRPHFIRKSILREGVQRNL